MRHSLIFIAIFPLLTGISPAQEEQEVSNTEQLRESVREWIETMREVQEEENAWERDKEVLEDQRAALRSEIGQLKEQIERARTEKEGADKESLDEIEKRDALAAAKEKLAGEVRKLEEGLLARLPALPRVMIDGDPRVGQMIAEIKEDAQLNGDAAKDKLSKRLNNVLNLMGEAEKWQATVHLRDELHKTGEGREFNMKVVYFGLGSAYAVNEGGDYALVGRPEAGGWTYTPRPDLAPQIDELVDILNGDLDAKFISLPFELP